MRLFGYMARRSALSPRSPAQLDEPIQTADDLRCCSVLLRPVIGKPRTKREEHTQVRTDADRCLLICMFYCGIIQFILGIAETSVNRLLCRQHNAPHPCEHHRICLTLLKAALTDQMLNFHSTNVMHGALHRTSFCQRLSVTQRTTCVYLFQRQRDATIGDDGAHVIFG